MQDYAKYNEQCEEIIAIFNWGNYARIIPYEDNASAEFEQSGTLDFGAQPMKN